MQGLSSLIRDGNTAPLHWKWSLNDQMARERCSSLPLIYWIQNSPVSPFKLQLSLPTDCAILYVNRLLLSLPEDLTELSWFSIPLHSCPIFFFKVNFSKELPALFLLFLISTHTMPSLWTPSTWVFLKHYKRTAFVKMPITLYSKTKGKYQSSFTWSSSSIWSCSSHSFSQNAFSLSSQVTVISWFNSHLSDVSCLLFLFFS